MKIKQILTLGLCAFAISAFSQTKLIAFKSHSGSSKNFKTLMENNLFNNDCSNFGRAPERYIQEAQLDSVIYVSDSTAIMVTSRYCKREYYNDTFTKWKAGREMVFKHPLFSQQHALNGIKRSLKKDYYFRNSIDKVKFIGYDNIKPVVPKQKKDTSSLSLVYKEKKDSSSQSFAYKEEKESPKIKHSKRHTAKDNMLKNDMVWLLEIVGLLAMATGVTFFKLR